MEILQYQVGQIPAKPLRVSVRGTVGMALNLSNYTTYNAILLDPDNNRVDLTGASLNSAGAIEGEFVFRFPTDRSLFTETGDYLLQLELLNPNARDFTDGQVLRVTRLGGNK